MVNRSFVHIPSYFQQHLPTSSLSLFRNMFYTFPWLCLGLACSITFQLLVPCQAQSCTRVRQLLPSLCVYGVHLQKKPNGCPVNLPNRKLILFPFNCLNCSSVRHCQLLLSELLPVLK